MAYLELCMENVNPGIKTLVDDTNHIQVDFLLPNGILLPLSVDYSSPLDQIKRKIWREIHTYPLAHCLRSEDSYSFMFINKLGEKEEVLDESQNVEEVQPFLPLFQLIKTKGDNKGKTLDKNINNLIGRGLDKQESFHRAEINHFKEKMSEISKDITLERRAQTPIERFQWRYPLRLRSSTVIPPQLVNSDLIAVDVAFHDTGMYYKLMVDRESHPYLVVEEAIKKRYLNPDENDEGDEDPDKYILKVVGQEEYIYGDYSLIQFKYIYQCLVKRTAPTFRMVQKSTFPEDRPPVPNRRPTAINPNDIRKSESVNRLENKMDVWNCESKYRVFIQGISKVQLNNGSKIKLYAGLYHGSESLCKEVNTEELTVQECACMPNIEIVFDIGVADLPLGARLCFALYTFGTNMKRKDLSSWVNIPVYDFKRRLQRGDRELPMWPQDLLQQPDEHCYPLGGVSLNATYMETTFLSINFPDLSDYGGSYLMFPEYDKVLECAARNMEEDGAPGSPTMTVSQILLSQLRVALYGSEQLFEQDKELIWMLRYETHQQFPKFLSKVLQSVKWNNHIDVAKMIALLQTWPTLPVDNALELLDFEYPDYNVRKFAVGCLDSELSDDDLAQFMLQLVQALKFETYLHCPLAEFLLRRALKNQHLGHKLFWLLKSESHNPTVKTQYGLILDCYLRNNHDHLMVLVKQQEALKKLYALNSLIKVENIADQAKRENAKSQMQDVLRQSAYKSYLSDLYSPLSPLYKLKELKVDSCRFMNSKKRPLWLVWSNADSSGPDIQIIYKNGDDLRQDMLTLQVLQVMDNLWQADGLDFRMNPYMCMATDLEQGMIEVVTPAETIANIQKWYKKNAFDKKALFEWLKDKHTKDKSLDNAVEEFLMSCAGYCVATYVLGIGDRHNDNIMMKHSGQMFHIDFGHFLGNFKSKFHVKRERVPFVLTSHFVYVITKGQTAPKNFDRFQEMCVKAFMILRSKFTLLMSVFMMMLSGGIPQLSAPKDCNYLKETLVPHLSEEEAIIHFKKKFNSALDGSWKTSVNFWFHIKAK